MNSRALASFAPALVLWLSFAVPAHADPMDQNDAYFLDALRHGSICCPGQTSAPIWHLMPLQAIPYAKTVAAKMSSYPNYQQFSRVRDAIAQDSTTSGGPMNAYETGEFIVIAVRYYAPLEVEHALIASMGDEAAYWYGTEVRSAPMVPVR